MLLYEEILNIVKDQMKNKLVHSDVIIPRLKLNEVKIHNSMALIISGIRRSGKSVFLDQLKNNQKGVSAYFNFEDTRLNDFDISDFEKLDKSLKEVYGNVDNYFFDEIQNISKWEIYVRQLLDKNKKVVITGSNASMLSKELGTRLTGRYLKIEIFPFSYKEYLSFKKEKNNLNSFNNYLSTGGFPEYLKLKKEEILQELLSNILERDIVIRYNLKNTKVLKDLTLFLISNIGKEYSFNSLKKQFSFGSVNTVSLFISYLEDSYLFFSINRFDYSLKKQLVNPKKIYAIDNGFIKANSLSFSKDEGRLFENLVFLYLREKYLDNIYYYKDEKNECDFLVREKDKIIQAIQVCSKLNSENKAREISGLISALKKFKLKEGLIITFDQEDKIIMDGFKIKLIPYRKLN
jgi:uncharacterized protein